MRLRAWTLAASTSAVVLVVGCTQGGISTSNGANPDGGAPGTSPSGTLDGGTTPSRLSCLGVLKCAADCPDEGVDACVQTCVDQTSESSQPVTTAFIQCLGDNQCADTTCVQEKCENELSACVADDATEVQGTPSSEPAPTGSVPAELVGLWSQVGLTSGMSYEFEADGATTQAFKSETNYGCESELDFASTGITTVSGDSLVYHRVQGTQVTKTCGTTKSKAVEPADIAYRYALGTFDDGEPKLSLYRVNEDGTISSPVELHH